MFVMNFVSVWKQIQCMWRLDILLDVIMYCLIFSADNLEKTTKTPSKSAFFILSHRISAEQSDSVVTQTRISPEIIYWLQGFQTKWSQIESRGFLYLSQSVHLFRKCKVKILSNVSRFNNFREDIFATK
jgi:hypothetical protein